MLKNYFKIAFRKIKSQRFYALTNILGLSIGICCCLLITLLVLDEISYDSYNERAEDIYRVAGSVKLNGVLDEYAYSPALLADAMEAEIPEVENTVRLRGYGPRLLRKEGTIQNFRETRVMHVDASLFDIFTLPLIYGSKEEVLKSPNGIVLTQSTAEKYFGKANPVGESMILDNSESYRVDGVCVDIPSNAHFHFDVFLPTVGLEEFQNSIWLSNNAYTYFLAKPNSDREVIQSKIAAMYRKHADAQLKQYTGADFEEFEAAGNFIDFNLQPLKSIHLNSNLPGEHEPNGDKAYVWIFAGIALFILLIACINFMNLSTARSAHRAKEVGMRKVLGSKKGDLVGQFLMESILISSISFSLAILLGRLLLPAFNELTNKDLSIPFLNPIFLGTILVAIILIGILAGSYPAFFLSAFEPLKVLKGNMNRGVVSGRLRQFLVTSQFSISIVLMIGTGVIYNQLNFIQKKRLGFNKEQVMVFQPTGYQGDFDVLKNQIDALPEVKESTVGCFLPVAGRSCRTGDTYWLQGNNAGTQGVGVESWTCDYDYQATFDMELAEGRFFSREFADSASIVLNEAAVKAFGLQNPIGTRIQHFTNPQEQIIGTFTVVGVLKDFNYASLKDEVYPLVMHLDDEMASSISMRFDTKSGVDNLIEKVSAIWDKSATGQPFNYFFLDEEFNTMYESEQQLGRTFLIFAALAIFIACLGLLALAAFTAERRNKEISIRKVLGASVPSLVYLLSSEFLKLVMIAIVISIPVAWYAMNRWLENFAYSVKVQWWIFVLAGIVAISIALLTVSIQSIRAALANPMKSLRNE